jgi:hypothetical protein
VITRILEVLADLFDDVLRAVAVLAVLQVLRVCLRTLRMRRSHLAGVWYQTSPDPRPGLDVVRVDYMRVHTFGPWIWGSAERREPPQQQPKRWHFLGRVSGSLIAGFFWTTDVHSNPRSCGTFHLQMIDPSSWVGHYTTAVGAIGANSSAVTQRLRSFRLEWARELGVTRHVPPPQPPFRNSL